MSDETNPAPPPVDRILRVLGSPGFLCATLVLAAALRVWHVLSMRQLPLFDQLILDSEFYDAWARRLSAGDWLDGNRPYFFDPLYPYFLAGLYRVLGRDLLLARLVNVGLGVATVGVLAVIGRRVGGAVLGNLAALLYALYRPAIFEEAEIEKTALGVFLLTCALAFALHRSTRARFASGVLLGLGALARGNAVLLIPIGAVYFLLCETGIRQRTRSAGAFLAGALLAFSPAVWRNHHVSGEWILTTSGAGPNLYLGNNPWNPTGAYQYLPWIRPESAHEEEDWRAETRRRVGRDLGPRELSTYWLRETFDYARANPSQVARVTASKVGLLVANAELPDGWGVNFISRFSPALRLPLVTMAVLFPLSVVGTVVGFSNRKVRFVAGATLCYGATLVAFYVFARFRIYYAAPCAVLAATAIQWGIAAPARPLLAAVAGAALLAVASVAVGPWVGVTADQDQSQQFANLSAVYIDSGDLPSARKLLVSALAEGRTAAVLCAMGQVTMRSGQVGESLGYFKECVDASPGYPNGWYWYGRALELAGNRIQAAAAYMRQLEFVPGHREASERLQVLMQH